MKDLSLNPSEIADKALELLEKAKRYTVLLFCMFFAVIYCFVLYRVQVLNSTEPSAADVTAQSQTASVPNIDPKVLNQLQQLRDNSVVVQSLFNDVRSNPFQE